MGLFEEANSGILFLDEIGDIQQTVQNKLLRAIEESDQAARDESLHIL